MWRRVVERRVRQVFRDLEQRRLERVLAGLAEDVHHRFAGTGALGGERHRREDVAAWLERLFRLYDDLRFEVQDVAVSGVPWRATVAVEWTAHAVPVVGPAYDNRGAHLLRIERGRVTHLHAYEDSEAVHRALAVMLAAGVEEAGAPPLSS